MRFCVNLQVSVSLEEGIEPMTRYRSYDRRVNVPSQVVKNGAPASWDQFIGEYGSCEDVEDGWDKENPFLLDRRRRNMILYNGVKASNYKVTNYALTALRISAIPSADKYAVDPNWSDLAFQARANTNPQKPGINLPAFLGEGLSIPPMLMDLPLLLCGAGKRFLKRAGRPARKPPQGLYQGASTAGKVAKGLAAARHAAAETGSQYVGAQFGWKPLVGDLMAMLDLQRSIARQLELLLRLLDGRSIRSRMILPTTSKTDTGSGIVESYMWISNATWTDVYRIKEWVTSRWAPTFVTRYLLPDLSDSEALIGLAMRLATGMTRMGLMQALWELLPWSWLFDWWFNFGRLLAGLGNSLALQLESLSFQRTSRVTRYYAVTSLPSWITSSSGGPNEFSHLRLYRKDLRPYLVLSPIPAPTLPLLTGRQCGILGGLLAQAQSTGFRR
jgi:hypothetical protein